MDLVKRISGLVSVLRGSASPGTYPARLQVKQVKRYSKNAYVMCDASQALAQEALSTLRSADDLLEQDKRKGSKYAVRLPHHDMIQRYWSIAYSAGFPIETLSASIDKYLDQLEYYDSVFTKIWTHANNRIIDVGRHHVDALFCLGWLVGIGANSAQIRAFLSFAGEPGQDALFDRLANKLGFERQSATSLLFPRSYQATLDLLDCQRSRWSSASKRS